MKAVLAQWFFVARLISGLMLAMNAGWLLPAQAATYANKSVTFNWISTATHAHLGYNTVPYKMNGSIVGGTPCGTAPPILDDTISDNLPIGFTFNYGGINFTQVRVMSNGRLQFYNPANPYNTTCGYGSPVTQLPYMYYQNYFANLNYSMRIYGNDLDPTPQVNAPYATACTSTSTCYMSYATIGTAPNRQFVVTWNNVPEWAAGGSTSGNYNLQVILNEDGTFVYQYGSDTPGPQAPLAQVGWQIDQTDYDIPNVGLPVNNSAILFYIPAPIAQYHFQQASWTAPGDVLDTSGSVPANNGTALGNATPVIAGGHPCNGASIPYNNKTNTIDAIDTGIPVPSALGGTGTIDFWYKANANWVNGGDAQLLDATTSKNQWFYLVKRNNGDLRFVITDAGGTYHWVETPQNNISGGIWTHIAVDWNFNALAGSNRDHMRIYVNGAEAAQTAFTTNSSVSTSIGTLYIGDNRSGHIDSGYGTANSANGILDEVNIYNYEGGTGLIQRDMDYTAVCGGPDHIRIQHDGNGLTCAPETLTVIACANTACTANYTGSPVTGNVTWAGNPGGSVPFNITTNGTTTVSLSVTTAQTVTLGTSAVNPAGTSPGDCLDTGTNTLSCGLTFADSGFLISAPDHAAESLQNVTISTVQTTSKKTCAPVFKNVARTVNLTCTYSNPTSGTLPVRVAGYALNAANNTASACDATGQSPSLAFDSKGIATVSLQYADVGQMALHATYTGSTATGDAGLVMTGNGSFIAAPASFAFSNVTASPIKAGNNFNATVSALNTAGTATPNFSKETPQENVTLGFTKCQPTGTGATNGNFSGSLGAFANGVATANNLSWDEVGNADLAATLTSGNYLGSGLTATGNTGSGGSVCNGGVGTLGFIPDHFDTVVTGPMACPAGLTCPPVGGLVYSGQPFTANVYARNAAGATTLNYDGTANTAPNFARQVTLSTWDAAGSTTTQNPGSGSFAANSNIVPVAAFTSGSTASGTPATPSYAFGTVPTAPTDIYLRAADADATSLRGASSAEGGVKVVSGRIQLANAYGSELLDLPIDVAAQYWDGSSYVASSTDNASSFSTAAAPAGNLSFTNCQALSPSTTPLPYCPPATAPMPASVVFANGTGQFILKAPGSGNTGSVDLGITGISYLPSNTARATFGVYGGSNNMIYMRESY